MLSEEDRGKKISYTKHLVQAFHERSHLFPHCLEKREMFTECIKAFRNSEVSMIFEDERDGVDSSHICMFLNEAGELVAIPLAVNEGNIHFFTLKDVKADWKNPNWFIRKYNEVAESKELDTIPEVVSYRR